MVLLGLQLGRNAMAGYAPKTEAGHVAPCLPDATKATRQHTSQTPFELVSVHISC